MAKILLVDDIAIIRKGTALVLQSYPGWEIEEASCGAEALAMIKLKTYSAVLMDYDMPGMNGFECATQIRDFEKATGVYTPIICITANQGKEIEEACRAAGMVDYLSKECSNDILKTTVLKWVQPKTDLIDLLPCLKAGDSYRARSASVGSCCRRVISFAWQANRASPALKILIAPTTSAFSSNPHLTHKN